MRLGDGLPGTIYRITKSMCHLQPTLEEHQPPLAHKEGLLCVHQEIRD